MEDVLDLWLVRHGETDWNATKRVQGHSDVPLNALGERQARALAERLKGVEFDQVYASDLSRACRTAQLCFPAATIHKDNRLREIHLGNFEGRDWTTFDESEQQQASVWFAGPYDVRVPGGESSDDLLTRSRAWLSSLPSSGRVIAFAHGGIIATILYSFTGRPEPRKFGEPLGWGFRLRNTSISRLHLSRSFATLETVNDYAHLVGLEP